MRWLFLLVAAVAVAHAFTSWRQEDGRTIERRGEVEDEVEQLRLGFRSDDTPNHLDPSEIYDDIVNNDDMFDGDNADPRGMTPVFHSLHDPREQATFRPPQPTDIPYAPVRRGTLGVIPRPPSTAAPVEFLPAVPPSSLIQSAFFIPNFFKMPQRLSSSKPIRTTSTTTPRPTQTPHPTPILTDISAIRVHPVGRPPAPLTIFAARPRLPPLPPQRRSLPSLYPDRISTTRSTTSRSTISRSTTPSTTTTPQPAVSTTTSFSNSLRLTVTSSLRKSGSSREQLITSFSSDDRPRTILKGSKSSEGSSGEGVQEGSGQELTGFTRKAKKLFWPVARRNGIMWVRTPPPAATSLAASSSPSSTSSSSSSTTTTGSPWAALFGAAVDDADFTDISTTTDGEKRGREEGAEDSGGTPRSDEQRRERPRALSLDHITESREAERNALSSSKEKETDSPPPGDGRRPPPQPRPAFKEPPHPPSIRPPPKPVHIEHAEGPGPRGPTYNCRVLNPEFDGRASAANDWTCPMTWPGIAKDNTCRCTYEVEARDDRGCATGFIYTCRRV